MKRGKIRNVAASVRQRLLNEAHASGRPFNDILQYFAMERFLYRLSKSPHDMSRQFDFDGRVLTAAVRETFARRDLEVAPRPVALTEEFATDTAKATQWRGFLRKSRLKDAPGELAEVVGAIAVFLSPVAEALHKGRDFERRWQAPGPWSPT